MALGSLKLDGLPGVGLPGTDFAGAPTTLTNGSISISPVPEPSSLLMVAVLALTGCCCRGARQSAIQIFEPFLLGSAH